MIKSIGPHSSYQFSFPFLSMKDQPKQQTMDKPSKQGFLFSKLARLQDDHPDPKGIKDIISLKAHGATNVDKIEAQDPIIFMLSISPENKVSITFGHITHSRSKWKEESTKTGDIYYCFSITGDKSAPVPVVFDPELLLSKKLFTSKFAS